MWTVDAEEDALKPDGSAYSTTDLREIQDWIIRPQLRMVKGVTEVNAIGGFVKQYHVTPYPEKLLSFGLTLQDVVLALERNNLNVGAGYIEKSGEQHLVRVPGQVANLDEIADIILGNSPRGANTHQGCRRCDDRQGAAKRGRHSEWRRSGAGHRASC